VDFSEHKLGIWIDLEMGTFADFYNNEQALGLEEVHGETHHAFFDKRKLFILCVLYMYVYI